MVELNVQSSGRTDFIDVTAQVARVVGDLGLEDAVVTVFNPHTTAAVTINEGADPDVVRDMEVALDKLIPWNDAHIKASLYGSSVQLIVQGGRLMLGTWQKIWFCDFDGPRTRRLWVTGG